MKNIRGGIEHPILNWELMGAMFANLDNETQATFFKGMCKELFKWDTRYQAETQLAYVNGLLTKEEKSLLAMIGFDPDEK